MLKQFFSLEKVNGKKQHTIIKICGVKFSINTTKKIKYPIEYEIINKLQNNIKPNTFLMVEANDFHGVIMPGYIKYLLDLHYNVDLLTLNFHEQNSIFCRMNDIEFNSYYTNISTIEKILKNKDIISKYKGIFVNSLHIFVPYKHSAMMFNDFFKLPKNIIKKTKEIIVAHGTDNLKDTFLQKNHCITLADTKQKIPIVNPHYFGEVNITSKNQNVIFLISGDNQKTLKQIEKAVLNIINSGISNFKIHITGRANYDYLSNTLKQYIKSFGFVDFPKLYELIEEADFIIPNLDPECEKHNWYLHYGSSGAFLLAYGFGKPCIIAQKFANKALLNSSNSIIYNQNSDLEEVLKQAINLPTDEYNNMQNNLLETAKKIYQQSLHNLKSIIGTGNYNA